MKRIMTILLTFLLSIPTIQAQVDTTEYENDDDWNWHWDDNWWNWKHGRPFLELSYGIGRPDHKNVTSNFSKIGLAELKLGYISMDYFDDSVIHFNERFSFVSKLETKLQSDKNRSSLSTELFRFGFGRRNGYGYEFESLIILPYTQRSVTWSKLQMKDYPISILPVPNPNDAKKDLEIINRYENNFRFGTAMEGGIQIGFGSLLSFNAGYEAAVIFPRHMILKHLGSYAIEMAGYNALDNFIDEVIDYSPFAGPIVNFILKNAYSFVFFQLKKDKMNWPFNTETPLTYETLKFGITFNF
jgi:hypothetical protein